MYMLKISLNKLLIGKNDHAKNICGQNVKIIDIQ